MAPAAPLDDFESVPFNDLVHRVDQGFYTSPEDQRGAVKALTERYYDRFQRTYAPHGHGHLVNESLLRNRYDELSRKRDRTPSMDAEMGALELAYGDREVEEAERREESMNSGYGYYGYRY